MNPLTASGLDRAEACPLSTVLPRLEDRQPRAYRDQGRAVHEFLKAIADGVPRGAALAAVPDAFRPACEVIDVDQMPHAAGQWRAEVALAYDPTKGTARELHDKGDRDYSQVVDGEVPGTTDLVGLTEGEVVVLDVKTGRAPLGEPGSALQLLHNALALSIVHQRPRAVVGWVKLWNGEPRFETATLGREELEVAARRIREVQERGFEVELAFLADPDSVTPVIGDHCRYCPSWFKCPAQMTLAATVTRAALGQETMSLEVPRERRGEFVGFVQAVEAFTERLVEAAKAMATEEPITLPNGKVYGAEKESREYLDPLLTQQVLTEVAPQLVDDVVSTKLSASKDALTEAAQKHLPPGTTRKAFVVSLLATLRARGAAFERTSIVVRARKAKALPALTRADSVASVVEG